MMKIEVGGKLFTRYIPLICLWLSVFFSLIFILPMIFIRSIIEGIYGAWRVVGKET